MSASTKLEDEKALLHQEASSSTTPAKPIKKRKSVSRWKALKEAATTSTEPQQTTHTLLDDEDEDNGGLLEKKQEKTANISISPNMKAKNFLAKVSKSQQQEEIDKKAEEVKHELGPHDGTNTRDTEQELLEGQLTSCSSFTLSLSFMFRPLFLISLTHIHIYHTYGHTKH